jgi:hypothetical protein
MTDPSEQVSSPPQTLAEFDDFRDFKVLQTFINPFLMRSHHIGKLPPRLAPV